METWQCRHVINSSTQKVEAGAWRDQEHGVLHCQTLLHKKNVAHKWPADCKRKLHESCTSPAVCSKGTDSDNFSIPGGNWSCVSDRRRTGDGDTRRQTSCSNLYSQQKILLVGLWSPNLISKLVELSFIWLTTACPVPWSVLVLRYNRITLNRPRVKILSEQKGSFVERLFALGSCCVCQRASVSESTETCLFGFFLV